AEWWARGGQLVSTDSGQQNGAKRDELTDPRVISGGPAAPCVGSAIDVQEYSLPVQTYQPEYQMGLTDAPLALICSHDGSGVIAFLRIGVPTVCTCLDSSSGLVAVISPISGDFVQDYVPYRKRKLLSRMFRLATPISSARPVNDFDDISTILTHSHLLKQMTLAGNAFAEGFTCGVGDRLKWNSICGDVSEITGYYRISGQDSDTFLCEVDDVLVFEASGGSSDICDESEARQVEGCPRVDLARDNKQFLFFLISHTCATVIHKLQKLTQTRKQLNKLEAKHDQATTPSDSSGAHKQIWRRTCPIPLAISGLNHLNIASTDAAMSV
ncbi:hypothetical protein BaRGS_00026793, partial [Batillaria attramentaria]